tara:strand:- start:1387 stop:1614 length:228 start_codon:yes stop_codon:yes gene_type:complete
LISADNRARTLASKRLRATDIGRAAERFCHEDKIQQRLAGKPFMNDCCINATSHWLKKAFAANGGWLLRNREAMH